MFSSERESYQKENENENIDASKIFTTEDAYHDQENDEIEEFKMNYEYSEKIEYFANTSTTQIKVHTCRKCQSKFYFNNKFHRHLRQCQIMTVFSFSTSTQKIQFFQDVIIQFNVRSESSFAFEFRFFRYVTMKISIEDTFTNMCVNIECEISLIDKDFLIQKIFNYQELLRQIKKSLKMREIDDVSIEAKIYIVFRFRMSNTDENDKSTIEIFTRRVFIVKHLKTKIFFDNDIFESKQMNINVEKKILIIDSCKSLVVQFNLINFESQIKRIVRVNETMKISVNFATIISFKFREKSALSTNRDFMFHFAKIARLRNEDDILSHIIDAHTRVIQIHNTNFEDVFISKNSRLKIVQEYEKEDCYLISQKYVNLIVNVHKSILKMNVSTMIVDATMTINTEDSTAKFATNFVAISINSINFETEIINFAVNFLSSSYHIGENQFSKQILSSKITVYDDFETRDKLFSVADNYSNLWNDNDFIVKISANEWMSIEIIFESKIEATKMYSFDLVDRKLVDEVFDKLHVQNRMKYTSQFIIHDYSIFAIWKNVFEFNESERKDRMMIDIRDLNKIAITDFYFMSFQTNIISFVTNCRYISVFDVADFFHQWLVKMIDRHKFIVVSHKEQEQFNVTIMKFKNSSLYVQRKIDNIFRVFRNFARVYVDDIVIFNNTLEKHVVHFHSIFELLNSYDISLFSKKSFFDYFIVAFLEQKMNVFDFIIVVDKLEIIVKLNFFYILKNFETYLKFIEWLREFVSFYAQKIDALQRRKILFLRQFSSIKKFIRKIYFKKIVLNNFSTKKLKSYKLLQKTFNRTFFLIHFNSKRIFYINIDVFKRREFDAMIYHLKFDVDFVKSKRSDIESILFLFRMLNEIETKYWLIELEMCELMWIIRRVRHMIKTTKQIIVIFIDHVVNTFISKQTIMNSNNIDKFNLRLMRVFTYLFQFKIEMKYRSNKEHIIFDALFRLFSKNEQSKWSFDDKLNFDIYYEDIVDFFDDLNCYAFQETFIAMFDEFKKKIKKEYQKKKIWRNMLKMFKTFAHRNETKIIEMFEKKSKENSQDEIENVDNEKINVQSNEDENFISKKLRTKINFAFESNEIIYHLKSNARRSYILISMKHEIFRLAHDENQHFDVHRCYERIASILYVFRLFRKFRKYIEHCFQCQLTQIKRHRLYDELNSIISFSTSFHTIAMNFILTLSNELNTLFIVICKYSRRIILVANKKIYNAFDWANALLNRFLITNWKIFETIISNKDSRFMSEFWRTLFTRLGTKLFTFTTYHFQIDDNSERTNQIVKIALRYFIIQHSDILYVRVLPFIQAQFNNSSNVVIELFSNEINYDFKMRDALVDFSKINTTNLKNRTTQRLEYRQETQNVNDFVVAKFKIYYDVRHMFLLLNSKEYVYFRLNQNYQLSDKSNRKFSQQRCELFKIIRRVERLAYELELSFAWRIHLVIFIAQLESISVDENLYQRFRLHYSNFVKMKKNIDEFRFYEIERLMTKRQRKYNKIWVTQYLIRWIEYDSEYDEWRSLFVLKNCFDLIKKYELNYFESVDNERRRRTTREM